MKTSHFWERQAEVNSPSPGLGKEKVASATPLNS